MESQLYDELYRTEKRHWWFVGRRKIVRELLDRYCRPVDPNRWAICEVGCGTGGNLEDLANDHDVVGFDPSEKALQLAQQRLGDRVVHGTLPDGVNLPKSSYDVVLATDVFEHIEDDQAAVESTISLLRPNGILVTTVPAYPWLFSPRDTHHQHFRRYRKRQFAKLFDLPDVEIELISYYNSFLFPPAAMARMWSKCFACSGEGDLRIPPQPINSGLTRVFASERHLLGRCPLPFGLSVVAVVRKLDTALTPQ